MERKITLNTIISYEKSTWNNLNYSDDCDATITATVKTVQNNTIEVTYAFDIEDDPKFTITHSYSSLLDFLSNPRKKFNPIKEVQMFSDQNWAELNDFDQPGAYTDSELLDKFNFMGIEYWDSVHSLYALVNNEILKKTRDIIYDSCVDFEHIAISETGNTHVRVDKVKNGDGKTLYYGVWTYDYYSLSLREECTDSFSWISETTYDLIRVLFTVALAYHDNNSNTSELKVFDRINYQLDNMYLINENWTEHYTAEKTNTITTGNQEKVTVTVYSSDNAWKAAVTTSINNVEPKTVHVYANDYFYTLLDRLNDDSLLDMLIDDYNADLIADCVCWLREENKEENNE